MNLDDIKIYLPKFLSADSERELFNGLKDFPENIDERLYTTYLIDSKIIYQGDGLNNLLVINLPQSDIKVAPGIILSNTCDIDLQNHRNFPSQIVYAPIFNLEKYKEALLKNSKKTEQQIDDHIKAIKKQEITQIFYLPRFQGKLDESIVFLDRVNNMPNNSIDREKVPNNRIFTLSDYGAYLFLLKISVHFTRIRDNVERKGIIIK
ncbi:MAG: hypothetical protein PWQ53_507 [Bacteroidota bacterium]|jgi:hypothetical protein|nr:hypothetical protein [Bacteroidota bacterium]MDN5297240.1 hypothetical protein [Bacteroidota bacterium]MDN5305848.1 hypothetical protein [Bacteroidota bacterium]